ncbi:hypothetical protein [Streptomyces colonosanans]|uniref:Integral membrane protein n=1 Tax=Streptomyces colonosanans TaxID=1428652 RepID=A0A1S2PHF8_9ACTN|nr:hypothetical protein [Streptomyces colonosanans]OIJ93201.1 hypothetical protein BIV24_12505 [Streptomyces colonosanans]
MSDVGELDRPGTPGSPGAWDARSEEWLMGMGETSTRAEHATTGADTDEAPEDVQVAQGDALGEPLWEAGADSTTPAPRSVAAARYASTDHPDDGARRTPARRGAADPVKALMHRHHELCERAVDPLEIAVGLEAHGLTDRAAARFRHRDVFSLAEEMYARVPRAGDQSPPRPAPADAPREHWAWAVLVLLPGALCTATVVALRLTEGRVRLAVAVLGALAVVLGLRTALGRGPLRVPSHVTPAATRATTCWLLAYALLGDGLLRAALEGGPDGLWPPATTSVLALALACGPAAWCARLLAVRARRRLAASRGLEEFASSVTPLLLGAFGLFLCALGALLVLCGAVLGEPAAYAGTGALGALLLLARLLTVHGFGRAPAAVLGAAAAIEATALATVFAGRLPGCSFLATPVETLADAWGADAVPTAVCALAALTLLIHATRTLTRASAHALPPGSP